MSVKSYAGVGSRRTPDSICSVMTQVARHLEQKGWHLLTGGAVGADRAFEAGVIRTKHRHVIRPNWFGRRGVMPYTDALDQANIACPIPHNTRPIVRRLFARNVMQVLGVNGCEPVKFVLCWTPDAAITRAECNYETGGTRYAIAVADMHGIPVFNLARPDHLQRVQRFVKKAATS